MSRNPGKGSFARCVESVSRRGGVSDPNAVCAASKRRTAQGARELERASKRMNQGRRKRNMWPFGPSPALHGTIPARGGIAAHSGKRPSRKQATTEYKGYTIHTTDDGYSVPALDRESRFEDLTEAKRFIADEVKMRRKNAGKRNPAEAASEAYTGFHGRAPDELVKIEETVHFHRHLAGAGELRKIEVHGRYTVTLSNFKGALLAFNEKRTQLFIKGGDQAVDLAQFGIKQVHEIETLGEVRAVEYFTRKDHLGKDGGTSVYVHRFHKPYPLLIYRTIDKKLEFSGGSYDVPDEGIEF